MVTIFKIILFIIIAVGAFVYFASKEGKKYILWKMLGFLALEFFAAYIVSGAQSLLFSSDATSTISTTISTSENTPHDESEETHGNILGDLEEPEASIDNEAISDTPEIVNSVDYLTDITGKTSVIGSITKEQEKDEYKYTSKVDGLYHFSTNLSSGGEVRVRISGENGDSLKYDTNALSIDLEAGKTYILSVEYRTGPCDYTVNIGVPIPIIDISGQTSVTGNITYRDQKDKYYYTAPTSGTYRFDTNLSSGGEVRVRISGENDDSLKYDTNALSIDLEAGKTYILSVEYRTGPCDYTVNIGVPIPITDITGQTSVTGSITYQDQKDKYYYTAPTNGTYRFDTNLSSGGEVRVRISGENGNSLKYDTNALSIDLEAGKTYTLSVEYRTGPCNYTINIGVPIPVTDITGQTSVTGNITYRDQKDKYYYTAPTSGTYRFDTNLSSGGEVRVRISGENDDSLKYDTNALSIDLEAGKTYILSVEYRTGPCDYTVNIGVPIPITDITGQISVTGSITYRDQKDKYYYTAPTSGTYCFGTDLSSGSEVRVRISGENGNSLKYDTNTLSMDLEAGKTYILSIEHRTGLCDYTTFIEFP